MHQTITPYSIGVEDSERTDLSDQLVDPYMTEESNCLFSRPKCESEALRMTFAKKIGRS